MTSRGLTMAMSIMFALRLRSRLFRGALVFGFTCCMVAWGQARGQGSREELYLLAATTTQHTPQSYPVVLYRVGKNKDLEVVREVVPRTDGVRFVYAWGSAIFALHPHTLPTSVAIVHTNEPRRADDVVISSTGVAPSPSATTVAAPPHSALVLLVPWITDTVNPTQIEATLARVSSDFAEAGPRARWDSWGDYAFLRREGEAGGPNYEADMIASAVGGNLAINVFGHSTAIERLPPDLSRTSTKIVPIVVAASPMYLILTLQHTWAEIRGGKLGESTKLYVDDRSNNRWSQVQAEGNSSILRLSGRWLTAIVGNWSENHPPNPGRNNERTEEGKTDRLPPVQTLFSSFRGRNTALPGKLVLQNLADGRKIRIETGQEDSEVLWVGDDKVLYRVNDTIYQARIDGEKLKDTTVVVKDEDVPEIHWVFWSQ
jgi:hypothetical protein